ncbi:hypothetical protein EXIGLDRAFT_723305 [Exidia glandulosa HHB12029]|uniref:Glycosyl transferase family 3 domain-containing protein n=1 Tax=Exidia glandulosa HHB12029 TaxID=1314781 RepID=A0A165EW89_EXIGL|nr:hypothetical protein EXIGLDRAFT_723305 [Exidia glandulosa HHB12029]
MPHVDLVQRIVCQSAITPNGLPRHALEDMRNGAPEESARELKGLLRAQAADCICIDASRILVCAGAVRDFKHGVIRARESIWRGRAWTCPAHGLSRSRRVVK